MWESNACGCPTLLSSKKVLSSSQIHLINAWDHSGTDIAVFFGIISTLRSVFFISNYYLRLKMVIPCPRIQRIIHLENFWQGQKILWELSFSTVYRLWHYDHSFLVKFALLSQNPWEKKRRVSISLSEILFLHWFSVKSKQSLFTRIFVYKGSHIRDD